jgi:hypothetical protein
MEQLEDNLKLEKSFSVVDEDGEIGLDVSGDTRWDKQGSGSNYNSDSGCHLNTGNNTAQRGTLRTPCAYMWHTGLFVPLRV